MGEADIDIREVLTALSIDYVERGGELKATCPNPNHEDSNPSWNISTEWPHPHYCFACGYHGTVFKLINQFGDASLRELLPKNDREENYNPSRSVFPIPSKPKPKRVRKAATVIELEGTTHSPYSNTDCTTYLDRRGITEEFVRDFGLFYVDHALINKKVFSRCLCVPVYERGRLINVEGRPIYPERAKTKTIYPPKSVSSTLFNIDNLDFSEPLYVTEGIMDLPKLYTLGYHNITSVFGALITNRQKSLLKRAQDLYIIPDNDSSGRKMVAAIDEFYPWEFHVIEPPKGKKDVGDCTLKELEETMRDNVITSAEFLLKANGVTAPRLEGVSWW